MDHFHVPETQLLTIDITSAVGAFSEAYAKRYTEIREELLAGVSTEELPGVLSVDRFASGVGILYILYLAISLALYIFRKTLIVLLVKIGEKLCPSCCKPEDGDDPDAKDAELASGLDTYSRDFLADLRIETLADKYRKSVVDLHDAQAYDVDEQSMMNQELKDGLVDVLKRRLRQIETAIDAHVDSLIEEKIIQPKVNMQEFFQLRDKPYEKKLLALMQGEGDLIARKKRLRTPCLRMKGIT